MEQIILHLVGDFVTQTQWMAVNKSQSNFAAGTHALVYALPFLFIGSLGAVSFIFATHFLVDRFTLARYVCFAKNWVTTPSLRWADVWETGYPKEVPVWLATSLVIVVDNTIHLSCNYAALLFL